MDRSFSYEVVKDYYEYFVKVYGFINMYESVIYKVFWGKFLYGMFVFLLMGVNYIGFRMKDYFFSS